MKRWQDKNARERNDYSGASKGASGRTRARASVLSSPLFILNPLLPLSIRSSESALRLSSASNHRRGIVLQFFRFSFREKRFNADLHSRQIAFRQIHDSGVFADGRRRLSLRRWIQDNAGRHRALRARWVEIVRIMI